MNEIILTICLTLLILCLFICITVLVIHFKTKNEERKIILDERERKDKWEKAIFDRNETIRKEKKEEEKKKVDNQQQEIESLKNEIAHLKQSKAIEHILVSGLGDLTAEELKKEIERIKSLLEEIK